MILRAWVAAGQPGPRADVPVMGSYERWRHVVGGVLHVANAPGFLANRADVTESVVEDGWPEFLAAWHERHGEAWVTAADVSDDLAHRRLGSDLWPETFGIRPDRDATRALAQVLAEKHKSYVAGFRVERAPRRSRKESVRWQVVDARRGEAGGHTARTALVSLPSLDRTPLLVVSGEAPL